jgi:nickel-dependent lactate racemase
MQKLSLPQLAWHGVKELKISLPDNWQVEVCNMAGYNRPPLSPAAMKRAIGSPIGMAPLRQYARGKKQVVILFDDMTRVTRVALIVPHVLTELAAAGIQDKQIRFIAAIGCHGALTRVDFVKKLGENVLKRFPVYNHNPFDNCVYVGTTTAGTKVSVNAEVMRCDLKIGIGSIVPHEMVGFGGGNKIILPGVAAYETVMALHAPRGQGNFNDTITGMGTMTNNPRRRDIDEMADIVGLDIIVNALVNTWGETVALFAGKPHPTYTVALEAAKKHYFTKQAREKDIVIVNSFAKVSEAVSALQVAFPSVKKQGGNVLLIANAMEGQGTHYLMGPFGNNIAGKLKLQKKVPSHVKRLIFFNEYPELAARHYLEDTDRVVMLDKWAEVLKLLKQDYDNQAKVAVYPNADIQYFSIMCE